jgi:glycosyltransferase involved in cell wall biosynthesis
MKSSRNYIVVTPCKNEGENLPGLVASMVAQTIKPVLWVIVDDGSTDDTPRITQEAAEKYEWIHVLRLDEGARDLGLHYATVVKTGFDHVISYCKENNLEYRYLGNLDGDLTLPSTFYENLMTEFEKDPELGIASGGTKHIIIGDRVRYAKVSVNEPSGGHMLIRKRCFMECGGIPLSYSIDSVLKAKARIKVWKTRRFEENVATEIRDVHAAEGYWKGFMHKGESSYYLNINPFHVIAIVVRYSFRKPYYIGIAYLTGYLYSLVRGKERINDPEIRRYFWNKWKEHPQFRIWGTADEILE